MRGVAKYREGRGVIVDFGSGEVVHKKTFGRYIQDDFLTDDYDRCHLYVPGGSKTDFKFIDFPELIRQGFTITPTMGLKDIKSLKISKPKEGKTGKRSREKDIWYLFDLELLTGVEEYAFRKTFGNGNLYDSLENFSDLIEDSFGITLKERPTIASLSLSAFKAHAKNHNYEFTGVSGRIRKACEESYYGAHTYCFNILPHENQVGIDANSHFASVMLKYPMPSGDPSFGCGEEWREDDLVFATVLMSHGSFPVLKTRIKDGTGKDTKRVGTGRLTGWYWGFELEFARERGATLTVHEWIRWPEKTSVLQTHIMKCRELRNAGKGTAQDILIKTLQNALYGKFSQRPSGTEFVISQDDPGGGAWEAVMPNSSVIPGWLWERPSPIQFNHLDMIHWGSFITAHARIDQCTAIELVGWRQVDYSDADSIFCEKQYLTGKIEELAGTDYGKWKMIGMYDHWQASAPKAYQWTDIEGKRGRKEKGIPVSIAMVSQDGESVRIPDNPSLRTILFQQKSRESRERIVQVSDPRYPGGRYDKEGFWVPERIDLGLKEYYKNRSTRPGNFLTIFEEMECEKLKTDNPEFSDPAPPIPPFEPFCSVNFTERSERFQERLWEKRFEWEIKNKDNRKYQSDNEFFKMLENTS